MGLLARFLLLAILVSPPAYAEAPKFSCRAFFTALIPGAKEQLKKAKAEELARLIAVDEETQKMVSDPVVAQYIYLNYFAEKTGQNELRVALQDIVDSAEAGNKDLYDLVNKRLASRLNDPEVQAKVKETFHGKDKELRPSAVRSKLYNVSSKLHQMNQFPTTIARLKKLVDEGFSQEVMDRGLFDFYGATQLGLKESQLRPWASIPGGFSAVRPGQVENISPDLWAQIAHFASETEKPIHGYSTNSGDALRGLLPSVSAFMGKNEEEYLAYQAKALASKLDDPKAAKMHAGEFCTNVWCKEENRHENAVEQIGDHVLGKPKNAKKTYEADPRGDFSDPEYGLKHLAGRNSSEWNANSVYFLLRAHSRDGANQWIDNIRQDETKHMAIFASAYKYFFGNQPNKRTKEMLDKILQLKKEAATANSSGNVLSGEGPTMFEMAVTHLFVEKKVRDFYKTVPLKTMEKLFDSPVKTIQSIESVPVPPEKQKIIDDMIVREREKRAQLARWKPEEREIYLALKQAEKEHAPLIESLITNVFHSFHGAEVPNSEAAKKVLDQIKKLRTGLDPKTNSLIQMSLRETLRDYQIMNNSFVRSKPDLAVRFKSAAEGFIVEHRAPGEVKVLKAERVNDSSFLVRVEKPKDETFEPGAAVKIEIDTPNGKQFRVLSLASSPTQDYLEFAVRESDSDFKKAFTALKPGARVSVNKAKGGMHFQTDKPAVMIAGGIGITPFRSMIQYAKDAKLKTPMHLIYANKNQIAFGKEFEEIAASTPELNVSNVLSQADESWKGQRGRVDEAYLAKMIPTMPKDAVYYIVGPPPMITGVKNALKKLGVPDERVKIEVFAPVHEMTPTAAPKTAAQAGDRQVAQASKEQDRTICHCQSVSASTIQKAVQNGATTLADIQAKTMAATGCGGCECNVLNIMQCELKRLGK